MRIGLIGYGAWGRQHAAAIERLPGLELSAIAVPGEASRAAAAAAHPGATVYRSYRELLACAPVDMADVVVPNHLHGKIAMAALAAGKHVLLEKPMAISLAECDRLLAADASSGRRISVGHELRLSSQWGRVQREIAAGRIGEPRHVSVGLFRNPYRPGADGWRCDPARVGSWSLEETVHFFDLALWYLDAMGEEATVQAMGVPSVRFPALFETLCAQIRFANGRTATINHTTGGFGHHQWVEVIGSEGAIRTAWQGRMDRDETPSCDFRIRPCGFAVERGRHEFEEVALAPSGELVELERQLALTAEAFREGRALVSAAEARRSVQLCLAAEEAARTNAPVSVSR
ncbi:MAG: Gfo/Idh/MocA family oxidoreductase [Alphaproteobacteria bacterium]|nr:Gfo/Idh/MocA family oxidoreductase [Alphaproteobacteria bacterium]MCB9928221.1 Gfo/Idh/MocA family oxidoreductase [Alphaproteobacteria bacterium]